MHTWIKSTTLELVQGDITQQNTEAIVNAANNSLLGGGGVDGAIHRAAGPDLLKETRALGGCNTGDAKITGGYGLAARYVIHAVGPVYRPGNAEVARSLESAFHRSMEIAYKCRIQSIAFPAISTGVYGYPLEEAAAIALDTVIRFVDEHDGFTLVRFVLFESHTFQVFAHILEQLVGEKEDLHLV